VKLAVACVGPGVPPNDGGAVESALMLWAPMACVAMLYILAVIDGYTKRWRIEELHRVWEPGALRVEQTQLRSAARVIKWAILAVVTAARIERLRVLARMTPDEPGLGTFTQHEIDALILMKRRYAKRTEHIPDEMPTIAQAVSGSPTLADTRVTSRAGDQALSPYVAVSTSSLQSLSLLRLLTQRGSCDEWPDEIGGASSTSACASSSASLGPTAPRSGARADQAQSRAPATLARAPGEGAGCPLIARHQPHEDAGFSLVDILRIPGLAAGHERSIARRRQPPTSRFVAALCSRRVSRL
jgi:hypothetical protein